MFVFTWAGCRVRGCFSLPGWGVGCWVVLFTLAGCRVRCCFCLPGWGVG